MGLDIVPAPPGEDARFEGEVERLVDGRDLNPFDVRAVEAVAGLVLRVMDARALIVAEGLVVDSPKGRVEHPAVQIEKRASQEIRGWVDMRPDLFGARGEEEVEEGSAFDRFRSV